MPTATPKYRAPALDKGLDILELLAGAKRPLSIAEISEGVGRSRGEIFRMLQVLEERDYIARGEGDTGYSVTPRLFRLGMEQPPVKGMIEAAMPIMHRLADTSGQACHLVVPSGEQIVVVARVDPPGEVALVVRLGHRRPMSQSTSGHVLLAFQDDQVRERWLDLIARYEPALDRKALTQLLTQLRERGYSSEPSHVVDAVTDLSAPVLQHGIAVCALTIPYIEQQTATQTMDDVTAALLQATTEISDALQFGAAARVP
ncbi:IclR family transcriptional regulator [Dyella mobilis]|uniref:IclR family transcriptional regulator n=1 Tax=Dyella mobilis TaxID=1849582 RepID=A0ABS2KIZ7_9GAMM|nr:IclR family transcriptional regulator [Dyella mobilis]MBM7131163.1 IclR family transcriptional regulator [Dyella mobilis]GLQ98903.1 transcriptional regulator [Dyella mobilis]